MKWFVCFSHWGIVMYLNMIMCNDIMVMIGIGQWFIAYLSLPQSFQIQILSFEKMCWKAKLATSDLGIGCENQDRSSVYLSDWLIGLDRNVTNIIAHPLIWIVLTFYLQLNFKWTTWENMHITEMIMILSVMYLEVWDLKFKPVTSNVCATEFSISAVYVDINRFS